MDSTTGCMGVGGYGDMDGGTKLKILTKRKEIVLMARRRQTDCTVGIMIIPIYREVGKTW